MKAARAIGGTPPTAAPRRSPLPGAGRDGRPAPALAHRPDPRRSAWLQKLIDEARAVYHPCRDGIHICGIDEEGNGFLTEANFPMGEDEARAVFVRARAECETVGDEPDDFVVDLQVDGDRVDDFGISRQMVARVRRMVEASDG